MAANVQNGRPLRLTDRSFRNGKHSHLPWGFHDTATGRRFATAEETAYPLELARTIAEQFYHAGIAMGCPMHPLDWSQLDIDPPFAAMRAIAGDQPKASKVPPLVPEFARIEQVQGPEHALANLPCPLRSRLATPWLTPHDWSPPNFPVPSMPSS